jgi:hypothetical protein
VTRAVSLGRTTEADAVLLASLRELYIHGMSEVFPQPIG